MAQFDVCRLSDGSLVVDVQADAVGINETRVVIPLLIPDDEFRANPRLAPVLAIHGDTRLCAAPLISVVGRRDLSSPIASLESERLTIQSALDLLLNGF